MTNSTPHLDRALLARSLEKKNFYTMEEVATLLGVQRKTVQRLMTKGSIRGFRASSARYEGALASDLEYYFWYMDTVGSSPPGRTTNAQKTLTATWEDPTPAGGVSPAGGCLRDEDIF